MEIQYFKSAWGDIKNSPGWVGKICLLALLNFIPIFGQIVTFGYLYGWAREIAWGTHEPLPAKIFSNEDGKLYRRGWFVLVLTFVFALVPSIIVAIGDSLQGLGMAETFFGQRYVANSAWIGIGSFVSLIGTVCVVFVALLAWVGNMRIAIYDRLSSGFQLGKVWKMFRHDTGGIFRIFGMELLVGLVIGVVLSIVFTVLLVLVVSIGVSGLIGAGYSLDSIGYMTNAQAMRMLAQFFISAGSVGFIALLVIAFASSVASVFVYALVIRALGYWTMQFDVPKWGGQDDPMPFELDDAGQAAYQPQPDIQPEPQPAPQQPIAPQQPAPVAQAAPVAMPSSAPDALGPSADATDPADDMPAVVYKEPAIVGAGFIMTPDEIAELEAEAQAQAIESAEAERAAAESREDEKAE